MGIEDKDETGKKKVFPRPYPLFIIYFIIILLTMKNIYIYMSYISIPTSPTMGPFGKVEIFYVGG